MEGMLVSGVAVDKNAARIAVIGIKDEPGMAFKVFDLLAKKNINVDIILQSIGRDGTKDISFTVSRDQMDEAVKHWRRTMHVSKPRKSKQIRPLRNCLLSEPECRHIRA